MGGLALRRVAAARAVGAFDVGRAFHGRARRVSGEACGVSFRTATVVSEFVDEFPGYKTCVCARTRARVCVRVCAIARICRCASAALLGRS